MLKNNAGKQIVNRDDIEQVENNISRNNNAIQLIDETKLKLLKTEEKNHYQ